MRAGFGHHRKARRRAERADQQVEDAQKQITAIRAESAEIDQQFSRLDARARNLTDLAYPPPSSLALDGLIHQEVSQIDRLLNAVDVLATWGDGRPVAVRELAGAARALTEAARPAWPTANSVEIDAARWIDLLEPVTALLRSHGLDVDPGMTASLEPDGIGLGLEL
jgi:hypothetical protein